MATTKARVKICGVTNAQDALAAESLGADIVGFIFAESPRRITAAKAAAISKKLSPATMKAGIFVNEDIKSLNRTVEMAGLTIAQLQGEESPAYIKAVKAPLKLKGIRVKDIAQLKRDIKNYEKCVDGFILDAYVKDSYGGTGKVFKWDLLKKVRINKPYFLAGGINPENAAKAMKACSPYGIDVSSGVEEKPGKKDIKKMKKLFENLTV